MNIDRIQFEQMDLSVWKISRIAVAVNLMNVGQKLMDLVEMEYNIAVIVSWSLSWHFRNLKECHAITGG